MNLRHLSQLTSAGENNGIIFKGIEFIKSTPRWKMIRISKSYRIEISLRIDLMVLVFPEFISD